MAAGESPRLADADESESESESESSTNSPDQNVPEIKDQITSVDEESTSSVNEESTSHHERISERLQQYDLVELKISGDGNCQFRSLSDQIYGTQERHQHVREQVVNQLKLRSDLYKDFVTMDYDDYTERMSKNSEWGDQITLRAAADSFDVEVFVITSFETPWYYEFRPETGHNLNKKLYLSFWADEMHYNSLYRSEELTPVETKKRNSCYECDIEFIVSDGGQQSKKKNKKWRHFS